MRSKAWVLGEARDSNQIREIVASSPSLRNYQRENISRSYRAARLLAAGQTGIAFGVFPEECPFDPDQVLDDKFFPEDPNFE